MSFLESLAAQYGGLTIATILSFASMAICMLFAAHFGQKISNWEKDPKTGKLIDTKTGQVVGGKKAAKKAAKNPPKK